MENNLKNDSLLEQKTDSTLAQSFWLGKSFQEGYKTGKLSHKYALEDEFAKVMRNSETFLSNSVHQLICESFEHLDAAVRINGIQKQEYIFTEAGHLMWGKIEEVLGEGKLN